MMINKINDLFYEKDKTKRGAKIEKIISGYSVNKLQFCVIPILIGLSIIIGAVIVGLEYSIAIDLNILIASVGIHISKWILFSLLIGITFLLSPLNPLKKK